MPLCACGKGPKKPPPATARCTGKHTRTRAPFLTFSALPQCDVLADTFGRGHVSVLGEAAYDAGLGRFWANQQAQTHPRCFFHPTDAEDVGVALLLARATHCPFAAKGGGHSAFKGSSNSDGGITLDFFHMKQVVPSADRKTVSIGPGNAWVDVYSALEPQNLTVVGGRVATVGVGGFLLGGGVSNPLPAPRPLRDFCASLPMPGLG